MSVCAPLWKSVPGAATLVVALAVSGCGGQGVDSEIAATSKAPPADAPRTPAEYDAKYPVPNAGDRAKPKGRGQIITNP